MQSASEAAAMQRPSFLEDRDLQLLLFGGKGGVGKTTCATATALRFALERPGETFLLVSTDPAHSLEDSLGGMTPPKNLTILELDAAACLKDFLSRCGGKLQEIAAAGTFLEDEEIGELFNLSLPGLDELMAFLRIAQWVNERSYDGIVVDTAPCGHTLRLLAMPDFLHRWLSMLDTLLEKRRYLRRVFAHSVDRDSLDHFVDEWDDSVECAEKLLRDPARCRFVPVTIAEALSVRETGTLLEELSRQRIPVTDLIVNQLHLLPACEVCADAGVKENEQVRKLCASSWASAFWAVPLLADEVCGAEQLARFWDEVRPLRETGAVIAPPPGGDFPGVEAPAVRPSSTLRLILFAGKGGVGKTTLCCATALRMARDFPKKRILLFSTDPAHSLSTCLEREIGPYEVPIAGGLSAMEIDADAELDALKAEYDADVEDLLGGGEAGFDLTFDRAVLEKMMDLAPPGLDEISALTRILDFLAENRYDIFVLDSAATGHFIRLLELPSLMDQWLKAFFRVLLHHKQVLRLPRFEQQLVMLSKNLKLFRSLLVDPARAMVEMVSIPTQMALQETKDLLAACNRLGIAVPALFLNLMTPPSRCELCDRLRRREQKALQGYQESFPRQQRTLVYRQRRAVGLGHLQKLARDLYQVHSEETIGVA